MKIKKLIASLAIPLGGGIIIGLLTADSSDIYGTLAKPPFSPSSIVFPIVWSILYALTGISLYLVLSSDAPAKLSFDAKRYFSAQLILNFMWPVIFFIFRTYWAAVVCLLALIIMTAKTYLTFRKISKTASDLLVPYIIWLHFALYLNVGVAVLN